MSADSFGYPCVYAPYLETSPWLSPTLRLRIGNSSIAWPPTYTEAFVAFCQHFRHWHNLDSPKSFTFIRREDIPPLLHFCRLATLEGYTVPQQLINYLRSHHETDS